jgi:glycosyltransferase involved in cell wall biosynthesis
MRNLPLFEGRLPLKMFEVMACARPFLLGVEGEARRIAEQEAQAAIYVEPENVEALVAGILYLQEHPEEAKVSGERGRAYVEKHYDRDQLTAELDTHIARLLEKNMPIALSTASIPESLPETPAPEAIAGKNQTY